MATMIQEWINHRQREPHPPTVACPVCHEFEVLARLENGIELRIE